MQACLWCRHLGFATVQLLPRTTSKMATTGTHLLGGRLNLSLVREAARAELKDVLGDPAVKKVSRTISQQGRTEPRSTQATPLHPYR